MSDTYRKYWIYIENIKNIEDIRRYFPTLIFISDHADASRPSWPEWLVTYGDGIPMNGHPSHCCSKKKVKRGRTPYRSVDAHLPLISH